MGMGNPLKVFRQKRGKRGRAKERHQRTNPTRSGRWRSNQVVAASLARAGCWGEGGPPWDWRQGWGVGED